MYSFLLSLYINENPVYLKRCLDSLVNQTLRPSQIVLVIDGPITSELDVIVQEYQGLYDELEVYRLKENVGLGNALNHGLNFCENEIVLRMDTDDICVENRARIQVSYLENNPEISVLGTYIEEITTENTTFLKKVPLGDDEIKKVMKKRNPINHPSVAFRKSNVLAVGGYMELKFNEDYFLWIRMAESGFVFNNLSESLVIMQVTDDSYARRGGVKYFFEQDKVYKYMKDKRIITQMEYVKSFIIRFLLRIALNNSMRKYIYVKILRVST